MRRSGNPTCVAGNDRRAFCVRAYGEERRAAARLEPWAPCTALAPWPVLRDGAARLLSDCLVCQADCHFRLSLSMALRVVRILRATAMRATIFGLPAASRRM